MHIFSQCDRNFKYVVNTDKMWHHRWVPYKTWSSGGAVGGVRWGAVKIFVEVPAFYILFVLNISLRQY